MYWAIGSHSVYAAVLFFVPLKTQYYWLFSPHSGLLLLLLRPSTPLSCFLLLLLLFTYFFYNSMSGVKINKQKTEWGQFGIRKMAKTLLNKRELRTPPTYFNILKDFFFPCYLAWPFTTSLNHNITI